ncbi:MAG: glycosyltransferase, partial [Sphingobacteriales bacterium]
IVNSTPTHLSGWQSAFWSMFKQELDPVTLQSLVGRSTAAIGRILAERSGYPAAKPELIRRKQIYVFDHLESIALIEGAREFLEELRKMVLQFQLQDEVVFAGFQKDIPEIMQAFDLFVMPSHQEAFGLVAIEAMAMECPIIISSGGSSLEIVGKEEFGLLMRPADAFDLQKQMLVLIRDEDIRKQMGKRAREHVKGLYDRRVRTQRTLQVYQETVARRAQYAR